MPTAGYSNHPSDADPRKWQKCRQIVYTEMIAQGWNKHAKKLSEVQHKRALKLFYKI